MSQSETIPLLIALTAMELMFQHGLKSEDAVFMAAVDAKYPHQDRDFAKAYGLAHWDALSEQSRNAWDWAFGRENRLPGWATRDLSTLNRIEGRLLDG